MEEQSTAEKDGERMELQLSGSAERKTTNPDMWSAEKTNEGIALVELSEATTYVSQTLIRGNSKPEESEFFKSVASVKGAQQFQ